MACQEKVVCDQVQGCQLKHAGWGQQQSGHSLQNQLPMVWPGVPRKPWIFSGAKLLVFSCLSLCLTLRSFELWPGVEQQLLTSNHWWREKREWHPEHGWASVMGVPPGSRGVGGSHWVWPRYKEGSAPSCSLGKIQLCRTCMELCGCSLEPDGASISASRGNLWKASFNGHDRTWGQLSSQWCWWRGG